MEQLPKFNTENEDLKFHIKTFNDFVLEHSRFKTKHFICFIHAMFYIRFNWVERSGFSCVLVENNFATT